jgi:hypothetical protein
MVRVIGQRFELNDSAVFIIAELEEQLERGGEELVFNSKKTTENPKEVSGAQEEEEEQEEEQQEEEGEEEESDIQNKTGPAKSPLSIIVEESEGMMKSLFPSSKSSEEPEQEETENPDD